MVLRSRRGLVGELASRKVRNLEQVGVSGDGGAQRAHRRNAEDDRWEQLSRFGAGDGTDGKRHERMARGTGIAAGAPEPA